MRPELWVSPRRRARRSARFVIVLTFALTVVGCVSGSGPSASTASVGPATNAASTPIPPSPPPEASSPIAPSSSAAAIAPIFRDFDGFTFRAAAPGDLESFASSVAASIGDSGALGEAHIAEVVRGDEPAVTVVAFSLTPSGDATEQTLFGLIIDSIAGGLEGEWAPALDGQAFSLETADQTVIVLPWATSQGATLFLLVTGPPDAPVEEVARGMTQ